MTLVYLTQALCNAAAPRERRYDLRDSLVRGLFLRVEVSGRKTWYLCYRTPSPERRLRNMKLASAAYAQLTAARRAALSRQSRRSMMYSSSVSSTASNPAFSYIFSA